MTERNPQKHYIITVGNRVVTRESPGVVHTGKAPTSPTPAVTAQEIDISNDAVFFTCVQTGCRMMKKRCVERQEKVVLTGIFKYIRRNHYKHPFCQTCEQGKEIRKGLAQSKKEAVKLNDKTAARPESKTGTEKRPAGPGRDKTTQNPYHRKKP